MISLICSDHVHVFENVNPRCLCEELSEMKSGGWFIWANFLDTIIGTVLDGLKSTNQSLAHRVIIPRSVFKVVAAVVGFQQLCIDSYHRQTVLY